jgi:hypothetical protein
MEMNNIKKHFTLTKIELNTIICALNYQLDEDENITDEYANQLYNLRTYLEQRKNKKFE